MSDHRPFSLPPPPPPDDPPPPPRLPPPTPVAPAHVCPTCGKAFSRDDLLRRHRAREQRSATIPRPPRQRSCLECSRSKSRCDLALPACGRCLKKKKPCAYATNALGELNSSHAHGRPASLGPPSSTSSSSEAVRPRASLPVAFDPTASAAATAAATAAAAAFSASQDASGRYAVSYKPQPSPEPPSASTLPPAPASGPTPTLLSAISSTSHAPESTIAQAHAHAHASETAPTPTHSHAHPSPSQPSHVYQPAALTLASHSTTHSPYAFPRSWSEPDVHVPLAASVSRPAPAQPSPQPPPPAVLGPGGMRASPLPPDLPPILFPSAALGPGTGPDNVVPSASTLYSLSGASTPLHALHSYSPPPPLIGVQGLPASATSTASGGPLLPAAAVATAAGTPSALFDQTSYHSPHPRAAGTSAFFDVSTPLDVNVTDASTVGGNMSFLRPVSSTSDTHHMGLAAAPLPRPLVDLDLGLNLNLDLDFGLNFGLGSGSGPSVPTDHHHHQVSALGPTSTTPAGSAALLADPSGLPHTVGWTTTAPHTRASGAGTGTGADVRDSSTVIPVASATASARANTSLCERDPAQMHSDRHAPSYAGAICGTTYPHTLSCAASTSLRQPSSQPPWATTSSAPPPPSSDATYVHDHEYAHAHAHAHAYDHENNHKQDHDNNHNYNHNHGYGHGQAYASSTPLGGAWQARSYAAHAPKWDT